MMTKQAFAEHLGDLALATFTHAYRQRLQRGKSECELLIEHDIQAAYENIDDHVAELARIAIRSAIKAVDLQIPWQIAAQLLVDQLTAKILLLTENQSQSTKRRTSSINAIHKNQQKECSRPKIVSKSKR